MARVSYSDLPAEILIQIYEEVIANRTRIYAETNTNFNGVTTFTPPGRAPETSPNNLRILLQLHATSRDVALRHIARFSGPITQHLGLVPRHNFNPATDLISFGWTGLHGDNPPAAGPRLTSSAAASLVLGAEFPNVLLHLREFIRGGRLSPAENPVTASMQYLTDPAHSDPLFPHLFRQVTAPQLPRTLYLLIGDRRNAEPGEREPQRFFTLEEMHAEGLQILPHASQRWTRRFLECWDAWSQIPGLVLPNVFFVSRLNFEQWITEPKDRDAQGSPRR